VSDVAELAPEQHDEQAEPANANQNGAVMP